MVPDFANLKVYFLALTLGQGGAERQLYYMLQVLKKKGTNLCVLSLTTGEYWETPIRDLGITVIWVGQSRSRGHRLIKILQELRRDPPHIFQSQHLFTNLYVALASRSLGLCEIGAIRGDGITGVEGIGQVTRYFTLHMPRVIAANSQNAINNVVAAGVPAKRLFLLPNVVNAQRFTPILKATADPIRLVSVGRLVEPKRFDRFLSTLHRLHQQDDISIQGIIVGSGPLYSQLEAQASDLGLLPDIVKLIGRIDDTAPVYQQADIFVLTSDWEGTPNVILEAMASGLPVVATNVGGVADVIQHGKTGFIVDPENESAMVQLLRRLTLDARLREEIGRQAREHIIAHYSLDNLSQSLEDLYSKALSTTYKY